MSDKDTIAALQRNLAAAEVERLRLVAEVYEKVQALSAVSGVLLGQDVPPTWDVYGAVQDARAANAEVERLREALEQVLVDINDPHPRTSTLEGFRGAMRATEAMVLRVLARNNTPLVTEEKS